MTEEILLDELNELCENWLCPMDLMDSIDDYTNEKIIDELQRLVDNTDCKAEFTHSLILKRRIKELKR